jgi:Putative peptidoglycan binding domain
MRCPPSAEPDQASRRHTGKIPTAPKTYIRLMGDQIVLLAVGFGLTTVVGGFLGYYFQRRTWNANRRESERQAAATVFDEISRLMDRRLYRMWLVHWRLSPGTTEERVEKAMDGYRAVLMEWNDSLNRNLALAYRYFGRGVWRYLDTVLYEEFARLGRRLEERYASRDKSGVLGEELTALSNDIYYLNRFMVSLIQHGRVGVYQTEREDWGELPPWRRELAPGSRGPRVAEWQRNLNLIERALLDVDGLFGPATHQATIAFQNAQSLTPDGIVGERTRQAMAHALPADLPRHW